MTTQFTQAAETEAKRLAALRMQMLEMHPFWGYILLQVKLVPAQTLPTMATDCLKHIWFNPEFTAQLNSRQLGFCLAHEVCHQVLESFQRQGSRETIKWNMAADCAIHDMVRKITLPKVSRSSYDSASYLYEMPRGVFWKSCYSGMIAEMIYEDLCRKSKTWEVTYVSVTLPTKGNGGNGESGKGETTFPSVPWAGGGCDVHLPVKLGPEQREVLADRIRVAAEHYHASSGRGDFPEELLREAGLLGTPKVPWQRVLHHYADVVLHHDDYSLACPNKRFMIHDLVVPGHYNERIGHLVAALDTSGSMSDDEIREVLSEVSALVDSSCEMTLIVADNQVRQVVSGDELESFIRAGRFKGGGGTDHVCVFDYIRRHHLAPAVFVGLSDLYSTFPEKKPPYPVLWVTPEDHETPPWGKVIEVPRPPR